MKPKLVSHVLLLGFTTAFLGYSGPAQSGTEVRPAHPPHSASPVRRSQTRVSQSTLLLIVRDFRDRLGQDPHLYYLVNPPGGAKEEERNDVESQIVRFLYRSSKDPSLDVPTRWIEELKTYELTAEEWAILEKYFTEALAKSNLSSAVQESLKGRFGFLRIQILG